jgi:hypothetical protein
MAKTSERESEKTATCYLEMDVMLSATENTVMPAREAHPLLLILDQS